jgi:hypothetical protein
MSKAAKSKGVFRQAITTRLSVRHLFGEALIYNLGEESTSLETSVRQAHAVGDLAKSNESEPCG